MGTNKQAFILQPPNTENEKRELENLFNNLPDISNISIYSNGKEMQIPYSIPVVLCEVIKTLNYGNSITLIPMDKELTTQQAADLLNVSRPYLIKLLENNEISYRKTGSHRKILMQDLMEYREKRNDNRKTKIEKLSQLSQEFNLYD